MQNLHLSSNSDHYGENTVAMQIQKRSTFSGDNVLY